MEPMRLIAYISLKVRRKNIHSNKFFCHGERTILTGVMGNYNEDLLQRAVELAKNATYS